VEGNSLVGLRKSHAVGFSDAVAGHEPHDEAAVLLVRCEVGDGARRGWRERMSPWSWYFVIATIVLSIPYIVRIAIRIRKFF
jgi:hypothetical protein